MIFTIAGIAFALVVLGIIVSMLLRRRLREKYATLWLVIGLALLVLAIFPDLLYGMARVVGVEVPSNLLFALSIVLLSGVALHVSWELSQAEEEIRRLAEEAAITRSDLEALTVRVDAMSSAEGDGDRDAAPRG